MLYWPLRNTLYVEGYALDRFAEGLWALQPVHQNKVVVFLLLMLFIVFVEMPMRVPSTNMK